MRRRRRAPTTQLARAGERTRILISDSPLAEVRFRASTLNGTPEGRIDIETVDGTRTAALTQDNLLDTTGLISLSVVPQSDTAITFVPTDRPANAPMAIAAGIVMLGAIAWTAYETLGG